MLLMMVNKKISGLAQNSGSSVLPVFSHIKTMDLPPASWAFQCTLEGKSNYQVSFLFRHLLLTIAEHVK